MLVKFEVRIFSRIGTFNAPNLWGLGLLDPGHALFEKFLRGHVQTVPWNVPAKFEVRSFECVGSRQRSLITIQNRWTQVRGHGHRRRQSLI